MSSQKQHNGKDPTPSAGRVGHESAEAVLATGDRYLVVGSVEKLPAEGDAGGTPDPGKHPIFYDDAHYDAWAMQLDDRGEPLWQRVYPAPREGHARAIAAMRDGFVLAGEHRSGERREYGGWLLRLAGNGEEVWRQVLGRPGITGLRAVVAREDGTIIAGGAQEGKGWLVAVDSAGALRWERSIDDLDEVTALVLHGSGFVLAGTSGRTTTSIGVSRLVAMSGDGQPLWSAEVPAQGRGEISALAALPGGGGVAVGQGHTGDRRLGAWVVRFGPDGAVLSSVVLPGPHVEAARAVIAMADGGYAVAGDSLEQLRDRRVRLWRMAADGTLQWQRTYGTSGHDLARGLALTSDGGLLAVGAMQAPSLAKTRPLAIRVDARGDALWSLERDRQ
jgi:hypothetical protein